MMEIHCTENTKILDEHFRLDFDINPNEVYETAIDILAEDLDDAKDRELNPKHGWEQEYAQGRIEGYWDAIQMLYAVQRLCEKEGRWRIPESVK